MPGFLKKEPPKSELLAKYMAGARKFQNIGIVLIALSILVHMIGHERVGVVVIVLFFPGALLLAFGGSCLQQHNLVKAFAQQIARDPRPEMVDAFLEVMERAERVSLTRSSIQTVLLSIEQYAADENADQEMVQKLRDTATKTITKKLI